MLPHTSQSNTPGKIIIYTAVFLTPLIVNFSTRELFEFPKMIAIYLLATISLFRLVFFIDNRFWINLKKPLLKPLICFVSANLLASLFSIDLNTSIFGYYTRFNGGLLSLISYSILFLLALAAIDKKSVEALTFLLSASALISSAYAILQHLGIDKSFWVQDSQARVFSTLGQPNWLAAYLLMSLPIALYLSLKSNHPKWKAFHSVVTVAIFSGIWFTYSLSGFLGLAFLGIAIPLLFNRKLIKNNFSVLLVIFLSCLTIVIARPGIFGERFRSAIESITARFEVLAGQDLNLAKNEMDTPRIRLIVWKGALRLVLSRPKVVFTGTGPETFAYAFLPYRPVELNGTTEWDFLYNKAHNYYLDLLSGSGLLGFLTYLYFSLSVILFYRHHRLEETTPYFLGWSSLLITNFFGWPTVTTSLFFFLFPAIIIILSEKKAGGLPPGTGVRHKIPTAFKLIPSILLLACIKIVLNIFLADISFAKAMALTKRGYYHEASLEFENSIKKNPIEPVYRREFAFNLTQAALQSQEAEAQIKLIALADKQAEIAFRLNPQNSLTLKSILRTYYGLSKLSTLFEPKVEEYAQKVTALSPTEPRAFYDTALVLSYLNKIDAAEVSVKKALELRPSYTEAWKLLKFVREEVTDRPELP